MNSKETFDTFHECESELDLFELRLQNIPIWDRIRNEVYNEVLFNSGTSEFEHGQEDDSESVQQQLLSKFRTIGYVLSAARNDPRVKGCRDILFATDATPRREKLDDGKYWDKISDTFLYDLSFEYTYLEPYQSLSKLGRLPTRTDDMAYTDLDQFIYEVLTKTGIVSPTLASDEITELSAIEAEISDRFDVDIDLVSISQAELTERAVFLPLYERTLDRVDPQVVVIRYNPDGQH